MRLILIIFLIVSITCILHESRGEKTSRDWMNVSGKFYFEGNNEIALRSISLSLELDPSSAEGWNYKGQILSRMNQSAEAISCYDKAIEMNPLYSEAWYNKGLVLDELDQYKDAVDCYDIFTKLEPRDPSAWNRKGIALRNLGRYEEAIVSYENAIKIAPYSAPAWSNKGMALSYLGRYEEALYCFNRTIEMSSNNRESLAQAFINKGLVLMLLTSPEDAILNFDEAINVSKGEKWIWTAWFSKGVALKSLGRYANAANAFDKAREIRLGGDPWKLLLDNLKKKSGL